MRCKHCGSENTNDAKFCEVCGRQIEDDVDINNEEKFEHEKASEEPGAEQVSGEVVDEEPEEKTSSAYEPGKYDDMYREYSVQKRAIKNLRSPFMLTATILLGVQVIFMLIYAFSPAAAGAVYFLGLDAAFTRPMLIFRVIVCVIAAIEAALFAGFMITFLNALGDKSEYKTKGLTILQVLCAAGLIILCLGGLCMIGAGLLSLKFYTVLYGTDLSVFPTRLIVYVCAAALAVVIIYAAAVIFFAKLLRTVGKAKKSVINGKVKKNISLYCAVILFIIAAFLLGVCIASLFTFIPAGLYLNLAEAALAAACVLYGIFIIRYRKSMKEVL